MVIALVGLALAMIAAGLWSVIEGYGIIVLERGWALVISGATVASLGAVLLGIAVVASRLGAVRAELVRQRERMSRPEPNFPDPPSHVDPVLAVSSGLLAGGASDSAMPAPPPRPQPAAPAETIHPSDASYPNPVPPPTADRRSDEARIARREEAAQRRARRGGRETEPAQPMSAGTLAAGAAAAVAAGAVVSAGLAAVRGRGEAADAASPGEPIPHPRPAADAPPAQALRGLDQPFAGGPASDELLPDRDSGPAGVQRSSGSVSWPVVPGEPAGSEPAFPAGAGAAARAPEPAAPAEEDAPFATSAPVVPDTSNADGTPGNGEESPAVLGTYNSGGNRYVMFADGSIEAETPDGTFRFGSLDELKAFIAAGGERPREG
jgi:hypothetical protein